MNGHTPPFERLMAKVDTSAGPDACHMWTGWTNQLGYGRFRVDGRRVVAHRWLLGFLRGRPLGSDELGCHHCDTPGCMNPRHLYVGDLFTNVGDQLERGRHFMAAKTECSNGHPFDAANTYQRPDGARGCRACRRRAGREYERRRRIKAAEESS